MQIFIKKRGQIVLKPAIEIIVAITIFLIFIAVGKEYGTGEIFQKIRASNDNALSADALYAFPGNAYLPFLGSSSKFLINFERSSVKIAAYENDPLQATHFFVKGAGPDIRFYFENPQNFFLAKSGDKLSGSEILPSPDKQRCPFLKTEKPNKIMLIPEAVNGENYQFTEALAEYLGNADRANKIADKTNFAIEIIPSDKAGTIKIYTKSNLESRRIACLIANNIADRNPGLKPVIIPSERPSLKSAEIWISLEIGKSLENTGTISAISDALSEY